MKNDKSLDTKFKIKKFIEQSLTVNSNEITENEELLVSGLVNSIGILRLVAFINDELSIQVPPQDVVIENFSSINQIINYLKTKGLSE